jgi:hypothetical protein
MAAKDNDTSPLTSVERLDNSLDIFGRAMSAVMMLLGLRQWAIILGVMSGAGGMFEAMTTPWQIATAHLAVVDLVASVGLWQRAPWGNVVWIYAAVAEIAMHTLFIGTYGSDYLIVVLHAATLVAFMTLVFLRRRAATHARA